MANYVCMLNSPFSLLEVVIMALRAEILKYLKQIFMEKILWKM